MKTYLQLLLAVALLLVTLQQAKAQFGAFDPSFGDNGTALFERNAELPFANSYQVFALPNGKILVNAELHNMFSHGRCIMRYLSNGKRDLTFGTNGIRHVRSYRMGINQDGSKIITYSAEQGFASFLEDGSPDPTFKSSVLPAGYTVYHIVIQADGRFLVGSRKSNAFVLSRYLNNGDLDTSFGGTGTVFTNFGTGTHYFRRVFIQSDGQILLFGAYLASGKKEIAISKYNPDGSPDTTYATAGKLLHTTFLTGGEGYAAQMQSDNKLIVTGDNSSQYFILRFNTDATLDTGFGAGGYNLGTVPNNTVDKVYVRAMDIQPDGRVIIAGTNSTGVGEAFRLRFSADGQPDIAFNNTAMFPGLVRDGVVSLDIQPNGQAVYSRYDYDNKLGLYRQTDDGNSDVSFGTNGRASSSYKNDINPIKLLVLPDDYFITVSKTFVGDCEEILLLTKFRPDGTIDPTFGINGVVEVNKMLDEPIFSAASAALLVNGNIVVLYNTNSFPNDYRTFIHSYLPDGSVDHAFNGSGVVELTGEFYNMFDIKGQPDGKIVVCGEGRGNNYGMYITRLLPDGQPDLSFGYAGQTSIRPPKPTSSAGRALFIQSDGKIVMLGATNNDGEFRIWFGRLLPDGQKDTGLGDTTSILLDLPELYPFGATGNVQPDGKIIIYGSTLDTTGGTNLILLRFNVDGTLDDSFGVGGRLEHDLLLRDHWTEMIVQPDGKLLLSGYSHDVAYGFINSLPAEQESHSILLRLDPDGQRDVTFGENGLVSNYLHTNNFSSFNCLGLQSDGKILTAGRFFSGEYSTLGLARITSGIVGVQSPVVEIDQATVSPNPSTGETTLEAILPAKGNYSLRLIDMTGRVIHTYFEQHPADAGIFRQKISLHPAPSGSYFLEISSGKVKKMVPVIKLTRE